LVSIEVPHECVPYAVQPIGTFVLRAYSGDAVVGHAKGTIVAGELPQSKLAANRSVNLALQDAYAKPFELLRTLNHTANIAIAKQSNGLSMIDEDKTIPPADVGPIL
jgi:hypothetical protein